MCTDIRQITFEYAADSNISPISFEFSSELLLSIVVQMFPRDKKYSVNVFSVRIIQRPDGNQWNDRYWDSSSLDNER